MRAILFILFVIPVVSFAQLYYSPLLYYRNDTAYLKNETIPYTGKYFVYYDFERYRGRYTKIDGAFRDGLKSGLFIEYYESKKLKSKINYIKGKIYGEAYYKHENAYLKRKEVYKNGKLHGKPAVSKWYATGQLKELIYYTKGLPDSVFTYEKENISAIIAALHFEIDRVIYKDTLKTIDTVMLEVIKLPGKPEIKKISTIVDTIADTLTGTLADTLSDTVVRDKLLMSFYKIVINGKSYTGKSGLISQEIIKALLLSETKEFYITARIKNSNKIYWNLPLRKVYVR